MRVAAAQTKIFGLRIPVDPKILFGGLAAVILLLWWYNSRGEEETVPAAGSARTEVTSAPAAPLRARTPVRHAVVMSDRGTLRLKPIDPSKGDIDPTLRLDLLARLQRLQPVTGGRSLFESGGLPATGVTVVPLHPPILPPQPRPNGGLLANGTLTGGAPVLSIPLKYYGYVKPNQMPTGAKLVNNRGFFLDGDDVLVASEGDVLKQQYLVVELTASSARLEDTRLRQGQTLPVVPAAMP